MIATPSQLSAITADSHSVIIANAGSGKTHTLVQKYIHLIETEANLSPAEIIAITFTDNSANELREKIIKEGLMTRLAECEIEANDPVVRDRLWRALQEIDLANISTIHGFCSRLLRQHPIEAHIDPAFVIIETMEQKILLRECVDSVLQTILTDHYEVPSPETISLHSTLKFYGRAAISTIVSEMTGRSVIAHKAADYFRDRSDEEIIEEAKSIVASTVLSAAKDAVDTLAWLFGRIKESGKDAMAAREAYQVWRLAKTDEERILGLRDLLSKLLLKTDNTARRKVFQDEAFTEIEEVVQSSLQSLILLLPTLQAYDAYIQEPPNTLVHSRNIIEIFERSMLLYITEKNNFGFLDQDDLIEKTVRLLEDQSLAEEIASNYKYCFIDEYQDTDERQYKILESLTKNYTNHLKVTVVGDPKQSIYRFRDANLEIFGKTVEDILIATKSARPLVLQESFRMLAVPLAVTNSVTDQLFTSSAEESYYSPIIQGITPRMRQLTAEEYEGDVRILASIEKAENEEPVDSEVELIAKSIVQMTSENNQSNRVREFKDIAILLRARTKLPQLEIALGKYSIPYTVLRGTGFYSQQEVIDVISFLKCCLDPSDDLSLMAILRSPYIAFDDRTLWNITHDWHSQARELSLWQFMTERYPLTENDRNRISILSKTFPLAGRIATSDLIRLFIEQSAIELVYSASGGGAQKMANLKKFISIASRNNLGPSDFIAQCELYERDQEREEQATADTQVEAVRIMTIHASKGLQFPVVYLPFLNDATSNKRSSSLQRDIPYFKLECSTAENTIVTHPIVELSKYIESKKEDEDDNRLLYVALTRAQDALVLSATIKKEKLNAPLAIILSALGITYNDLLDGTSVPFESEIEVYDSESIPMNSKKTVRTTIPIIRQTDIAPPAHDSMEIHPIADESIDLKTIPAARGITRYSPTQLLTYIDCPTKYYLRYKLGIPEETMSASEYEPADHSEIIQGSKYGQLLHRAFESIDIIEVANNIDETIFRSVLERLRSEIQLSAAEMSEYETRLKTEMLRFISTDLFKRLATARESHSELAIRFALEPHLILSGIIDRLFLDSDGIWNIIDYKTSVRAVDFNKAHYLFQIRFYAFLVIKLYNVSSVRVHLYFSHSGTTITEEVNQTELQAIHTLLSETVHSIDKDIHSDSLLQLIRNKEHCAECNYFQNQPEKCLVEMS